MNLFSQRSFSFRPGDEVAGFRITAPAGLGGSGEVYFAEDASGKSFALKICSGKRELGGLTAYRTLPQNDFLAEIYAAGNLPDGRLYLLMEAADTRESGGNAVPDTLAERIRQNPLPAAEALKILHRLLCGIELLHRHQLIHGDVKPENVIFCGGEAKLSDFGTLGEAGDCAGGTADFLPPEAFDRDGRVISDPGSDLYALGKLLYCAWSGRAPAEFPTPPSSFNAGEFKLIRPLCAKACHAVPAYRFRSAAAMRNAVEKALKKLQPGHRKTWLAAEVMSAVLLLTAAIFFCFRPHSQPTAVQEPIRLPHSLRIKISELDELLALCPPKSESARLIRKRQTELKEADEAGRKAPPEDPAIARFRQQRLSSPELYLSAEITQRVREIIAAAPSGPCDPVYGEIAFLWQEIEDECRYPKMGFGDRKKLAEKLKSALAKLPQSER